MTTDASRETRSGSGAEAGARAASLPPSSEVRPHPGALPVVLLHGLRTSSTMWRAQVRALEAAGRRVVAPDLPGHGTRIDERFTRAGAIETVEESVDEVGGRALVVGLSLGGYIGMAHAARHPEQVAGLVAAACSTRPARLLVAGWALAARGIVRLPDHGAALNQLLVERVLPPSAAEDAGAGGFALHVVEDVLREVSACTPLEDLTRIDAPVWLVNGRFDHFRGEERRFLAACRDGRLVVVPRATHLVSLVAPERFTRTVLEALDELEHGPRAGSAPGRRLHGAAR
ncbi:alpha/beta fold hydrolase [Cellulomonas sp. NS3]|uniref:alpha/beta fold hydrolase n=1 Tax=Cellulomonas sp. NS3 TaxID=2973977 RepID=UPI0021623037|nr:alpha/beta hydrolase [Cellulomonas sp. NS3]